MGCFWNAHTISCQKNAPDMESKIATGALIHTLNSAGKVSSTRTFKHCSEMSSSSLLGNQTSKMAALIIFMWTLLPCHLLAWDHNSLMNSHWHGVHLFRKVFFITILCYSNMHFSSTDVCTFIVHLCTYITVFILIDVHAQIDMHPSFYFALMSPWCHSMMSKLLISDGW